MIIKETATPDGRRMMIIYSKYTNSRTAGAYVYVISAGPSIVRRPLLPTPKNKAEIGRARPERLTAHHLIIS